MFVLSAFKLIYRGFYYSADLLCACEPICGRIRVSKLQSLYRVSVTTIQDTFGVEESGGKIAMARLALNGVVCPRLVGGEHLTHGLASFFYRVRLIRRRTLHILGADISAVRGVIFAHCRYRGVYKVSYYLSASRKFMELYKTVEEDIHKSYQNHIHFMRQKKIPIRAQESFKSSNE